MATTRKVRRRIVPSQKNETPLSIPSKPNEPPKSFLDYCTIILGDKGAGKTSLIAQFEGYCLLMLEPRRRNLRVRQVEVRPYTTKEMKDQQRRGQLKMTPWQEIQKYVDLMINDPSVKVIGCDTVDRAYDACFIHHCFMAGKNDPNDPPNDYGELWRKIKDDFESTFNKILYDSDKGLIFVSHSHIREVDPEAKEEQMVPSCKPACWTILKGITDYALYYRLRGSKRSLVLRGNEKLWTSCGTPDHFLVDGREINEIDMGPNANQGYKNLMLAFENKLTGKAILSP